MPESRSRPVPDLVRPPPAEVGSATRFWAIATVKPPSSSRAPPERTKVARFVSRFAVLVLARSVPPSKLTMLVPVLPPLVSELVASVPPVSRLTVPREPVAVAPSRSL